jgi:hypothetical protein
MITVRRRFGLVGLAIVLTAGIGAGPNAQVAYATATRVSDGIPAQWWIDLPSTDPRTAGGAGWGDFSGGVAARPYVTSLTVINGATATPVITGGTTAPPTGPDGGVTAVVSPFNLCRIGQTPNPGSCYTTPNRVGLNITYRNGDVDGMNFADPSVPVTPTVTADTVFDMTVALNTLGQSLRWTWLNGDLLYWQTSNLGTPDATVHLRFRPASTPYVRQFPAQNGCTATPIFNCVIARSDAQMLTASLVFSLDNTLDPALTGAAFATQNAIAGYLSPGGTPQVPTLDIQAASTHTTADGSPQLGTIEAFIPSAALANLYGLLPEDAAAAFSTTRAGDAGSNDAPVYAPWTAEVNGSDGLLVTVRKITFSVPRYKVANRLTPTTSAASILRTTTTVTATVTACSRTNACQVSVYDLGKQNAARYVATHRAVVTNQALTAAKLTLAVNAAQLPKGDRYLLVVRSTKNHSPLVSTTGTVR